MILSKLKQSIYNKLLQYTSKSIIEETLVLYSIVLVLLSIRLPRLPKGKLCAKFMPLFREPGTSEPGVCEVILYTVLADARKPIALANLILWRTRHSTHSPHSFLPAALAIPLYSKPSSLMVDLSTATLKMTIHADTIESGPVVHGDVPVHSGTTSTGES